MKEKKAPVLLLTGLSGAGRSSVLNILEDLGYSTIDNLPLNLAYQVICDGDKKKTPLALNIDLRSQNFTTQELTALVERLRGSQKKILLIFLESDSSIIERRYLETRRVHPLGRETSLKELICKEKNLLAPLRKRADHVIDTSLFTPMELKGFIRQLFSFVYQHDLLVDVLSFAYRKGIPREANFVFDMRFLKNPYYEKDLKGLTGRDPRVQNYLSKMPLFQLFKKNLETMLESLVKTVEYEGRGLFVLAFGCSGGQHRSVAMAEECYAWLRRSGYKGRLIHREL